MKTSDLINETYNMLFKICIENVTTQTLKSFTTVLDIFTDILDETYHQKFFMKDDNEYWIHEIKQHEKYNGLVVKYVNHKTYEICVSMLLVIPLGQTYDRPKTN